MNYARIYEQLIERRRLAPLSKKDGYCERHHFIPRCMGGGNEAWNLIYLTAKEHFVAHHLLCKANPGNGKLLNAFIAMCTKQENRQSERRVYISARRYEALKRAYGEHRRKMFATMSDEARERRKANIRAGCAKRTPEQRAAIKAKRAVYFASLTDEDRARINEKRHATIASRSEARKREIFEAISKSHRKLSEQDELRVVAEYQQGKTTVEIANMPWCGLSREGVGYLLRRRGVVTHQKQRWIDKEPLICRDYTDRKYTTNTKLAEAYGTSWSTIQRILLKNNIDVPVSRARSQSKLKREDERLRKTWVSYASPFGRTVMQSSLYDAIERLRMFCLIPKTISRRNVLHKIRAAMSGHVKYAYGYVWKSV